MYKIIEYYEKKTYTTTTITELSKIIKQIKKQKRYHYVIYYYDVGTMIEQDDNMSEYDDKPF